MYQKGNNSDDDPFRCPKIIEPFQHGGIPPYPESLLGEFIPNEANCLRYAKRILPYTASQVRK
jgi:hypothetical protein